MIYDLDLNKERDRIQLWRGKRVAHRWTKEEAETILKELQFLIPRMTRR